jgi:hypothetical protein
MGGYKRKAKNYVLAFEDPEMDGLEVRVKSMPVGKVREFLRLREEAEDANSMEAAFGMFDDCLLSWNLLDDDDQPVPANQAGIDTQDVDFIMAIVTAWMETITGVSDADPLDGRSTSGEPSLVASLPMVPLSASQAS